MDSLSDFNDDSDAAINITPLIDVCLTLVLVFMVTAPLSMLYGVTVRKDALRKYGLSTPQQNVVVHLVQDGVEVRDEKGQGQKIPIEMYGAVVREAIQNSATHRVLFQVDGDVAHGRVVWAMDTAKQNGAADIILSDGDMSGIARR